MKKVFLVFPLIVFFVLSGCDLTDYPFEEVTSDSLTIVWSIDTVGTVELLMLNCYMKTIMAFEPESNPCPAGEYNSFWNMQDSLDNRVPDGLYYFRLILDNSVIDTQLFEVYQ